MSADEITGTHPVPCNVAEYETAAAGIIPRGAWDYYAGGSDDEITLHANLTAFNHLRLRPRVLVDVTGCDSRTTVLGVPISMPVMLAPVAYQAMAHPEGELATARAAAKADTVMVVSINASRTLEEVAAASAGPKWLQLYVYGGDLTASLPLVRRAEEAGYGAIVLTVDRPVFGNRERDLRNDFNLPDDVRAANFNAHRKDLSAPCEITWRTVHELAGATRLPLVLKGILTGEDALLAVEHGAAGIVVSNHGGRQLDGVCAGIEALGEVAEAVAGACEVYCDGGFRRGTDVIKALALGARAVLIGRPTLWGLAVNGADGVHDILTRLREETIRGMKLVGRPHVGLLDPSVVQSAWS